MSQSNDSGLNLDRELMRQYAHRVFEQRFDVDDDALNDLIAYVRTVANQPAPTVPAGDALTANLDREKLYGLMMKFRRAREGHITGHADGLTYAFLDVWAYLESAALPAHQPAQEQGESFELRNLKALRKTLESDDHANIFADIDSYRRHLLDAFSQAAQQEPVAAPQQIVATDEPDMLWQTDDSERFAHGPDEFAEDYADDCMHTGETAVVDVDCATRSSKRTMSISVIDNGDDGYKVEWEWVKFAAQLDGGQEGRESNG